CCRARVSWPSLASLNPQACRSMCGWIENGILAASPTRWMSRSAALGNEHISLSRVIGPELAKRQQIELSEGRLHVHRATHLVTAGQMHAGNAVLDAGRRPLSPQAVAVGNQDHGRVAMPVATMLPSTVHQPLDLALGEVASLNCQVYDVWCAFLGPRFH